MQSKKIVRDTISGLTYAITELSLFFTYSTGSGLWNAWDVSSIYLIKNTAFKYINYDHEHCKADMAMSLSLRNANINLYVSNERYYGHLINTDNFNVTLSRPDLYNFLQNPFDWIRKYISTNYLEQLQESYTALQPCQDVYLFQIVTDVFADDLLAVMENYCRRKYNSDLENFDARAIHMSQVDLETVWLRFLQHFVQPLQTKIFLAKRFGVPHTAAHFIVRYKTDEEHFVAPKHNSRVYSANIALNRVGVEYSGGGRYFIRYNCSVIDIEKGWMIMHPGRITHLYTDLPIVKGISYTAVSLIYP
ncbi:hypothetical protein GQX74_003701 [Glossina fuscipes]|nr:hypothetical protein GQX74_003701 [Glossina fuscipes]